jgi:hypothetical protein
VADVVRIGHGVLRPQVRLKRHHGRGAQRHDLVEEARTFEVRDLEAPYRRAELGR